MSDYWKVEKDGSYYTVTDGNGNHIKTGIESHTVDRVAAQWAFRTTAAAIAFHANHLGIRPPAKAVELGSIGEAFRLTLDGQRVKILPKAGIISSDIPKEDAIRELRTMLAALDPEPDEVWSIYKPLVIGDGSGRRIVIDVYRHGDIETQYFNLAEWVRLTKAIAREANRIEAERARNDR